MSPSVPSVRAPYAGCEDINEPESITENGVLFMESEGEPPELSRLKRDLELLAEDFDATGSWLGAAMSGSWGSAAALIEHPALADLLGERHRIIANDWQAAELIRLVARIVRRAVQLLQHLGLDPAAIRSDLTGARSYPSYLYSASELLDRAADLAAESATLVHDNERRWRVFRERVAKVAERASLDLARDPSGHPVRRRAPEASGRGSCSRRP